MQTITAEWEEYPGDPPHVTTITVEYDCGYVWWCPVTLLPNESALHHFRLTDQMIDIADMTHDTICEVCRGQRPTEGQVHLPSVAGDDQHRPGILVRDDK